MNAPARPTAASARDRAIKRLQRLTFGTALASVAATGAFGYAAAIAYSGHTSSGTDIATVAGSASTLSAGTNAAAQTTTSSTSSSSSNSSSASGQSAVSVSGSTSVSAHVTTGGS